MANEQQQKIFTKEITEKSQTGSTKKIVNIDLSPWHFDADPDTNQPARSGTTCRIEVIKLGEKPSKSYINVDPSNADLRQALKEMYQAYDKLSKK